jgi:hypothetical protein
MTKQATFKRRIRTRMAKTGEKYSAARRVLIDQSASSSNGGKRKWVAQPELSDDRVREATGKGWDEWCDIIDAWPGHIDGHTAIANYVCNEHGTDGWWAQTVTVGYERITGLRLRYQRSDGTFNSTKTRTVTVDAAELRELLLDEGDRADLFPGYETELRSRPTSKVVRLGIGPGVAQIAIEPKGDGRSTISIWHEKLPSSEDVDEWKHYWTDWLEAVDEA